ncbi:MAG: exopolysaccharide biosynthesis polyprenyl glycosylphosphotransferase [Phycisphaerae bacterium]
MNTGTVPPLPDLASVTSAQKRSAGVRHVIGRCLLEIPGSSWLVLDVFVVLASLYQGFKYFPPPVLETTPHIALWTACLVFSISLTSCAHVFGLYIRDTLHSRSRIVMRMFLTIAAASIVAYAVIYVLMYATVSRRIAAFTMGMSFLLGIGGRLVACWAMHHVQRKLLVVGPRSLFQSFRTAQKNGLLPEFKLVGYTDPDIKKLKTSDTKYFGDIRESLDKLGPHGVTDIVVGHQAARDEDAMNWLAPALRRGCRVTNEAIFYEKAAGQILVDQVTPAWFLFADLKVHCERHATVQRAIDVIAAVVGLCLTAPFWPIIALAVKLCDGGPSFYSQERVGQNGRVFRLHKFRTMRVNAENGKSVWASPNDPRVTRIGRFLRKSRLDELPQLYNVLIGNMSIVGPRPERPDIVEELTRKIPYYAERHLVKPGITGWAQISYRYGASIEDSKRKLQFDLYYLKHMSMELDIVIILRTIGTFLKGAC